MWVEKCSFYLKLIFFPATIPLGSDRLDRNVQCAVLVSHKVAYKTLTNIHFHMVTLKYPTLISHWSLIQAHLQRSTSSKTDGLWTHWFSSEDVPMNINLLKLNKIQNKTHINSVNKITYQPHGWWHFNYENANNITAKFKSCMFFKKHVRECLKPQTIHDLFENVPLKNTTWIHVLAFTLGTPFPMGIFKMFLTFEMFLYQPLNRWWLQLSLNISNLQDIVHMHVTST